jgi:hypothetical protein
MRSPPNVNVQDGPSAAASIIVAGRDGVRLASREALDEFANAILGKVGAERDCCVVGTLGVGAMDRGLVRLPANPEHQRRLGTQERADVQVGRCVAQLLDRRVPTGLLGGRRQ